MPKANAIMIDMETLGTRADSVILSIGAVKFDIDSTYINDEALYCSVSVDSNHHVKPRHISEDTLNWWMDQSPQAKAVFKEAKTTLASALEDLCNWVDHSAYLVWSNGADFDIPMICHALQTHDLTVPWKFWNSRCFRTMKNLPVAKSVPAPVNTAQHNALSDAITQAKHLQAIWAAMKSQAKEIA